MDRTPPPEAMHWILNAEGGFVHDPHDPGGATNHGITQRVYDAWRHAQGMETHSVADITLDQVTRIYTDLYWAPMHCGEMCSALALMYFDTAVQWGVHGATELLAGCNSDEPVVRVDQIYKARVAFRYQRVKQAPLQGRFLAGWSKRDDALRAVALGWLAAASKISPKLAAKP